MIGTYDPVPKKDTYDDSGRLHKDVKLDVLRAKYWIGVGAQPSDTVWRLLSMVRDPNAPFLLDTHDSRSLSIVWFQKVVLKRRPKADKLPPRSAFWNRNTDPASKKLQHFHPRPKRGKGASRRDDIPVRVFGYLFGSSVYKLDGVV